MTAPTKERLTPYHEYIATFNPYCSCRTCQQELMRRRDRTDKYAALQATTARQAKRIERLRDALVDVADDNCGACDTAATARTALAADGDGE